MADPQESTGARLEDTGLAFLDKITGLTQPGIKRQNAVIGASAERMVDELAGLYDKLEKRGTGRTEIQDVMARLDDVKPLLPKKVRDDLVKRQMNDLEAAQKTGHKSGRELSKIVRDQAPNQKDFARLNKPAIAAAGSRLTNFWAKENDLFRDRVTALTQTAIAQGKSFRQLSLQIRELLYLEKAAGTESARSKAVNAKLGIVTRGRLIAQTEMQTAFVQGQLNQYRELGYEWVRWSANAERSCPFCASRHGLVYLLDEAQAAIPAHPRCRCTTSPTDPPDDWKKKKGKAERGEAAADQLDDAFWAKERKRLLDQFKKNNPRFTDDDMRRYVRTPTNAQQYLLPGTDAPMPVWAPSGTLSPDLTATVKAAQAAAVARAQREAEAVKANEAAKKKAEEEAAKKKAEEEAAKKAADEAAAKKAAEEAAAKRKAEYDAIPQEIKDAGLVPAWKQMAGMPGGKELQAKLLAQAKKMKLKQLEEEAKKAEEAKKKEAADKAAKEAAATKASAIKGLEGLGLSNSQAKKAWADTQKLVADGLSPEAATAQALKNLQAAAKKGKFAAKPIEQRLLDKHLMPEKGLGKVNKATLAETFDALASLGGQDGKNIGRFFKFQEKYNISSVYLGGGKKLDNSPHLISKQLKSSIDSAQAYGKSHTKNASYMKQVAKEFKQLVKGGPVVNAPWSNKLLKMESSPTTGGSTGDGFGFVKVKLTSKSKSIDPKALKELMGGVAKSVELAAEGKPHSNVGTAGRTAYWQTIKLKGKTGKFQNDDRAWLTSMIHEIGHQIHYQASSPQFWGKYKPSTYGASSHYEWFAETFVQYVLAGKTLQQKAPDAYAFVDRIVKRVNEQKPGKMQRDAMLGKFNAEKEFNKDLPTTPPVRTGKPEAAAKPAKVDKPDPKPKAEPEPKPKAKTQAQLKREIALIEKAFGQKIDPELYANQTPENQKKLVDGAKDALKKGDTGKQAVEPGKKPKRQPKPKDGFQDDGSLVLDGEVYQPGAVLAGSTKPRLYSTASGKQVVVKGGGAKGQNIAENVAQKVMEILSPHHALKSRLIDGKLVNEFVAGGKTLGQLSKSQIDTLGINGILRNNFAADALLANWDVRGLANDNIMSAGSKVIKIDAGGTFNFRAQGSPKKYGPLPDEIFTLRAKGKGQLADIWDNATHLQLRNFYRSGVDQISSNAPLLKKAVLNSDLPKDVKSNFLHRLDAFEGIAVASMGAKQYNGKTLSTLIKDGEYDFVKFDKAVQRAFAKLANEKPGKDWQNKVRDAIRDEIAYDVDLAVQAKAVAAAKAAKAAPKKNPYAPDGDTDYDGYLGKPKNALDVTMYSADDISKFSVKQLKEFLKAAEEIGTSTDPKIFKLSQLQGVADAMQQADNWLKMKTGQPLGKAAGKPAEPDPLDSNVDAKNFKDIIPDTVAKANALTVDVMKKMSTKQLFDSADAILDVMDMDGADYRALTKTYKKINAIYAVKKTKHDWKGYREPKNFDDYKNLNGQNAWEKMSTKQLKDFRAKTSELLKPPAKWPDGKEITEFESMGLSQFLIKTGAKIKKIEDAAAEADKMGLTRGSGILDAPPPAPAPKPKVKFADTLEGSKINVFKEGDYDAKSAFALKWSAPQAKDVIESSYAGSKWTGTTAQALLVNAKKMEEAAIIGKKYLEPYLKNKSIKELKAIYKEIGGELPSKLKTEDDVINAIAIAEVTSKQWFKGKFVKKKPSAVLGIDMFDPQNPLHNPYTAEAADQAAGGAIAGDTTGKTADQIKANNKYAHPALNPNIRVTKPSTTFDNTVTRDELVERLGLQGHKNLEGKYDNLVQSVKPGTEGGKRSQVYDNPLTSARAQKMGYSDREFHDMIGAVRTWSGSDYVEMRDYQFKLSLQDGWDVGAYAKSRAERANDRYADYVANAEKYVASMPKYKGQVQRDVGFHNIDNLSAALKQYVSGKPVGGMESWAWGRGDYNASGSIVLRLIARDNKHGAAMQKHSSFTGENEVLMPRGVRYSLPENAVIRKYTERSKTIYEVEVEQLD